LRKLINAWLAEIRRFFVSLKNNVSHRKRDKKETSEAKWQIKILCDANGYATLDRENFVPFSM